MNASFLILVGVTCIIFAVTAYQDIKHSNNVSSYLFAILPVIRLIPALIMGENIYWMNHLIGLSLAVLFLIFALMGKCGGADVIMAACLGLAYGFRDVSVLFCAACFIYLIQTAIYLIVKKAPIKEATRLTMPFIPASAGGFVCMIVLNHIIFVS